MYYFPRFEFSPILFKCHCIRAAAGMRFNLSRIGRGVLYKSGGPFRTKTTYLSEFTTLVRIICPDQPCLALRRLMRINPAVFQPHPLQPHSLLASPYHPTFKRPAVIITLRYDFPYNSTHFSFSLFFVPPFAFLLGLPSLGRLNFFTCEIDSTSKNESNWIYSSRGFFRPPLVFFSSAFVCPSDCFVFTPFCVLRENPTEVLYNYLNYFWFKRMGGRPELTINSIWIQIAFELSNIVV